MKRINLVALLALAVVATLAAFSQADALQTTKAFKLVHVVIHVLASPTPMAMHYSRPAPAMAPASAVAVGPAISRLVADPYNGPVQLASSGTAWDVAPQPMLLAQLTVQPTPVPVRFNAKADPNSIYLHVVPHIPQIDVPYGTTDTVCVFEVFTFYPTTYQLTDWGYGTTNTISAGSFPILNYNATSDLSWATPDFAPTFTPYANQGAPGQHTWSGTAGQSQQHCFSLRVFVPNSQPSGFFDAWIQYTLIVG